MTILPPMPQSSSSITITPITKEHLDAITHLHLEAFPDFFMSSLGARFLKIFYRSFTEDQSGIGLMALDNSGQILGAIVGPTTPEGYFKRLLLKHWVHFAIACTSSITRKPSILPRMLRALTYRGNCPSGKSRALLSSIAVLPKAQGSGIGKALVASWLVQVKGQGAEGCFLTTDADNNDAANHFYRNNGWKLNDSYTTPEGRRMNQYTFDF